jgi:ABC-type lipoprotein export system ATPase subunit
MAANHHNDEVFREKRKPKNPIKFKITLNEEQKEAKAKILENTITLLGGSAGSGKTLLACQTDLKKKSESGFKFLYSAARKVKNLCAITLTTNHRDSIVEDLISLYNEAEEKGMNLGTSGFSNKRK